MRVTRGERVDNKIVIRQRIAVDEQEKKKLTISFFSLSIEPTRTHAHVRAKFNVLFKLRMCVAFSFIANRIAEKRGDERV